MQTDDGSGKEILVIDGMIPRPDRDSGSLRMYNLLQLLVELGCRVTFAAATLEAPQPYTEQLRALGTEVLAQADTTSLEDYLQQNGHRFDTIILSRVSVATRYLDDVGRHAPRARILFDTVDLHHVREFRGAKVTGNKKLLQRALLTKAQELAAVNAADCTLVVSTTEQETLVQECPGAKVHVVSNIHQIYGPVPPFASRQDLLFIGSFFHHPNIDAVHYFLAEIFPLLREEIAGIKVYIAGDSPPKSIRNLANDDVIVTGYVPDVSAYFQECKVSIAPLRYGAGVKGKVHLSLSYGLPIVTSSIAAEGIYFDGGQDLVIADSPGDFCGAIVDIYHDEALWNRLSRSGQRLIAERYSVDAARSSLRAVFDI